MPPYPPGPANPPLTTTRTSHSLTIRVLGVTVGLINGWNPTQGRTVTPIFEVSIDDSGNPQEYMPGNASGLSINISRYDTYPLRMEQVFGTPDLTMLTRQNQPFDVIESWTFPVPTAVPASKQTGVGLGQDIFNLIQSANTSAASTTQEERFLYRGCWFTNLGRTLRSDDSRVVNVNATLVYTKKLKVTGIAAGAVSG